MSIFFSFHLGEQNSGEKMPSNMEDGRKVFKCLPLLPSVELTNRPSVLNEITYMKVLCKCNAPV